MNETLEEVLQWIKNFGIGLLNIIGDVIFGGRR